MNNCNTKISFDGLELSKDGSLILINKIDKIWVVSKIALKIHKNHDPERMKHYIENMMCQHLRMRI